MTSHWFFVPRCPTRYARRGLVVGCAGGGDCVGCDAARAGLVDAVELSLSDPPVPVGVDDRHGIRGIGLDRQWLPGHRGEQRAERYPLARGDERAGLALRYPESGRGVVGAEQGMPVGVESGRGSGPERGASPGRALSSDEPGTGMRVAAGHDPSEVRRIDCPREMGLRGAVADPPPRLGTAVGVVARWAVALGHTGRTDRGCRCPWFEVADDVVDHLTHGSAAGRTERSDGESHRNASRARSVSGRFPAGKPARVCPEERAGSREPSLARSV